MPHLAALPARDRQQQASLATDQRAGAAHLPDRLARQRAERRRRAQPRRDADRRRDERRQRRPAPARRTRAGWRRSAPKNVVAEAPEAEPEQRQPGRRLVLVVSVAAAVAITDVQVDVHVGVVAGAEQRRDESATLRTASEPTIDSQHAGHPSSVLQYSDDAHHIPKSRLSALTPGYASRSRAISRHAPARRIRASRVRASRIARDLPLRASPPRPLGRASRPRVGFLRRVACNHVSKRQATRRKKHASGTRARPRREGGAARAAGFSRAQRRSRRNVERRAGTTRARQSSAGRVGARAGERA